MIKDIGKYVDKCNLYQRIIKCSLYLIIQDLVRYFGSPNILVSILSKNTDCYESMLKGLSKETTLVLSNTRELDRVPKTK